MWESDLKSWYTGKVQKTRCCLEENQGTKQLSSNIWKAVKVQTNSSQSTVPEPDAALALSRNLLEMHILTESEILGAKPRNLDFEKALQMILMLPKLGEPLILNDIVSRTMANGIKLWGNWIWIQYKKKLVLFQAVQRGAEVNEFPIIEVIQNKC